MQSETEPCLKDAILLLTLLFTSCRLSPAGNPKIHRTTHTACRPLLWAWHLFLSHTLSILSGLSASLPPPVSARSHGPREAPSSCAGIFYCPLPQHLFCFGCPDCTIVTTEKRILLQDWNIFPETLWKLYFF